MRPKTFYYNKIYLRRALFILMLVSSVAHAQTNALKLTKIKHGEIKQTKLYEEGRRLKIVTLEGIKHKGEFAIIDNETLAIDDVEISLNEIKKIRLSSDGKIIIGSILLTAGIGVTAFAVVNLFTEVLTFGLAKAAHTGALFLTGTATYATGIFLLATNSPKNNNWTIEIIRNE